MVLNLNYNIMGHGVLSLTAIMGHDVICICSYLLSCDMGLSVSATMAHGVICICYHGMVILCRAGGHFTGSGPDAVFWQSNTLSFICESGH